MYIKSDDDCNPQLKEELGGLRGAMVGAANKIPMPERFVAVPAEDSPSMIITDTETGRTLTVGLCDYHGARHALNAFFGEVEQ
jgi:hypothetical protein